MKAKSLLPTTIVISAFLAQLTFAALPRYEIIDLGTLGGAYSFAHAINNAGQVVGWSSTVDGSSLAFLWDPDNGMIDLGTLDGQWSHAYSINNEGQIVGQASTASGYTHATLFHPAGEGNNIDLGTLGGDRSYASSINDNGQIVGGAQIASGERHATLFDPTGGHDNIDLGTLGGDESWASSINNSCQIVGTAYRLFTSPGGRFPPVTSSYPRAALFDPTGQGNNIDLGAILYIFGGRYCSGAMSINDSGHIVGAAWNEDPDPLRRKYSHMAVLFDPTGGENNIFLGTLGRMGSCAYSINNRDQIIGWGGICSNNLCGTGPALFDPNGFDPNGFFPTIQGNNVNLYDLIDPCCGWILKEVLSINDSGWIVGEGINPAGKHHAFLMKPIPPKVIYVDDDAAGANDGSSWADAYNDLQDALTAAWDGDEIRVAQGTYKPDQGAVVTPGDREATFQLINGVTIKGGYAGAGTPDPNSRDIELYETILSGDLTGNDEPNFVNYSENSYHVLIGTGRDASAALDGFTITCGNATEGSHLNSRGGGLLNFNLAPTTGPTLRNCTFYRNCGIDGGALVNYYNSSVLTNCTFVENYTLGGGTGSGAGIYNAYNSSIFINCKFYRNVNTGGGGGAMCNFRCNSTFTNCEFIQNSADNTTYGYGGGMYNRLDGSYLTLTNCIFSENFACKFGGGMYSNDGVNLTLTNCTFNENFASRYGGGMYNTDGVNLTLTNCAFSRNSAYAGAGMYNEESNPVLINCKFVGNRGGRGDGIYNIRSSPDLNNCYFIDNWLGMGNYDYSNSKLINCVFTANFTGIDGFGSIVTLKNCAFSGNKYGTFFDYSNSNLKLTNCTFSGHKSLIGVDGGAVTTLTNCIVWGNDSLQYDYDGIVIINYSCIQGGFTGIGNIDTDPCFISPGYWDANDAWIDGDFHLQSDSPCIDAGDPNYVAGPNEMDLDGRPRVIGGRIDMGVYEAPILAEARILPRTINLASKGKSITCYIWLSDDYDVADIEPGSVMLERQIKPEQFCVDEQKQVATATFDREYVQSILEVGDIKLTIACQLTDGTYFEATDIIQVTDKGVGQSTK